MVMRVMCCCHRLPSDPSCLATVSASVDANPCVGPISLNKAQFCGLNPTTPLPGVLPFLLWDITCSQGVILLLGRLAPSSGSIACKTGSAPHQAPYLPKSISLHNDTIDASDKLLVCDGFKHWVETCRRGQASVGGHASSSSMAKLAISATIQRTTFLMRSTSAMHSTSLLHTCKTAAIPALVWCTGRVIAVSMSQPVRLIFACFLCWASYLR